MVNDIHFLFVAKILATLCKNVQCNKSLNCLKTWRTITDNCLKKKSYSCKFYGCQPFTILYAAWNSISRAKIYIYIYIFSLGKYLRVTMSKLISTAELYVLIKTLFEFNKFNENAGSDSVCIRKHKLELCNIYSYINL